MIFWLAERNLWETNQWVPIGDSYTKQTIVLYYFKQFSKKLNKIQIIFFFFYNKKKKISLLAHFVHVSICASRLVRNIRLFRIEYRDCANMDTFQGVILMG